MTSADLTAASSRVTEMALPLFLGTTLLVLNSGQTVAQEMTLVNGKLPYDPALIAAIVELLKLLMSGGILAQAVLAGKKPQYSIDAGTVLRYAIPGGLYAVCNTLTYVAVEQIGSTQFQLFNNSKILTTAVLYRIVLRKPLKLFQWMALLLLTIAMCITTLHCAAADATISATSTGSAQQAYGIFLMMILCVLSSLAGVYSEKLLKGSTDHTAYQNCLLYFWTSLICLLPHGRAVPQESEQQPKQLFQGFTALLWVVIFQKAFYGQAVSLTLKYASNLLKIFANSTSAIASAIAMWVLLGAPLDAATLASAVIVAISVVLFYIDPALLTTKDIQILSSQDAKNKYQELPKMEEVVYIK